MLSLGSRRLAWPFSGRHLALQLDLGSLGLPALQTQCLELFPTCENGSYRKNDVFLIFASSLRCLPC